VKGMVRAYLRLLAVITGLGWPVYAVLAVWAEPVTVLLYGEQWRASAPVLPIVCLAISLTMAVAPCQQALTASKRVRLICVCETGLLVVWLALLLVLARFGVRMIAVAQTAAALLSIVIYTPALYSAIGLKLKDVVPVWYRSAVPAAAVGLVAILVRFTPPATALPLPLALALTGCLGLIVWIAAIWLVRHEFRIQSQELLEWGSRKFRLGRFLTK
jgi:O-antigen/teichoic acid export membrane protein